MIIEKKEIRVVVVVALLVVVVWVAVGRGKVGERRRESEGQDRTGQKTTGENGGRREGGSRQRERENKTRQEATYPLSITRAATSSMRGVSRRNEKGGEKKSSREKGRWHHLASFEATKKRQREESGRGDEKEVQEQDIPSMMTDVIEM